MAAVAAVMLVGLIPGVPLLAVAVPSVVLFAVGIGYLVLGGFRGKRRV